MSEKRCDVCGAPMLHTNNEMCKNYHLQKEPMTSSSEQQPKESHVRWFGRSEDDPNRLLIIEDDHCRVFLDADARAELYSVIDATRPHPAPAVIVCPDLMDADKPLGRKCRVNGWMFCEEIRGGTSHRKCPLITAARKAREEYTFADAIETFCYIDIYQYFDETRDIEDVSKCKGKECNYCGKFNEESTITTPHTEQAGDHP